MIEKILERLEECQDRYEDVAYYESLENGHTLDYEYSNGKKDGIAEAIEIVQEVAKEYGVCEVMRSNCEVAKDGGWILCSERLPKLVKNKYRVAFEHIVNCDRDASYLSDAYRNDLTDLLELINKYESNGWIPTEKELPTKRDWYLALFKEPDTDFVLIPKVADYLMGVHTKYTTEEGWIIADCTDTERDGVEYYKKLKCIAWKPIAPYQKGE